MIGRVFRLLAVAVFVSAGLGVATAQVTPRTAVAAPPPFSFQWSGTPAAPQPWVPGSANDWDLVVHDRDVVSGNHYPSSTGQHGSDCGPFIGASAGTHPVSDALHAVYICNNHVMTSLNAPGYGEVEMTPSHMADWSQGATSIQWSMSTLRTSARDWIDVFVTPVQENLELPGILDVDLLGRPKDAVHVEMALATPTRFTGELIQNFNRSDITTGGGAIEDVMAAHGQQTSGKDRARFELDISRTHVRFGMPDYNNWWIDRDIPALNWSQGVVQLGHHSYTPDKECNPGNFPNAGPVACTGDTWHWSNFSISQSQPFTMLRPIMPASNPTGWDLSHESDHVTFNLPAPAPPNSYLRMAAIGHVKYSVDGGGTWITPQAQVSERNPTGGYSDAVFENYWTPFPTGATKITFTGQDWFGGWWMINDPSIWSGVGTNIPPAPVAVGPPAQAAPGTPAGAGPTAGQEAGAGGREAGRSSSTQQPAEAERGGATSGETAIDRIAAHIAPPLRLPLVGLLIVVVLAGAATALWRFGLLRALVRRF